jgi:hypothetical protein
MEGLLLYAVVIVGLWALAHTKHSRPDGRLLATHPYRAVMGQIMRTRNESVVYFDVYVDADALERYVDDAQALFPVDITHCFVAACFISLAQNPSMNRFSSGHRLYERNHQAISFSMKRKQFDKQAKLATVKVKLEPGDTFRGLCERLDEEIAVERSDTRTYQDKEFNLFTAMPRPLFRAGVTLLRALDYYNFLPAQFIKNDPLFTSIFIANLGSLHMGAGFHHLYEWGNCPLFMMVGKIEARPTVVDGEVVARRMIHIRWSYDERIDDGLSARFGIDGVNRVLENPYEFLGCLEEDGSDARPLGLVDG